MDKPALTCLALSDFHLETFAGYLTQDAGLPRLDITVGPFGQVAQILMDERAACWQPAPDVAIVWTQPQSVIASFGDVLNGAEGSLEAVLREVDDHAAMVQRAAQRAAVVFVPIWVVPAVQGVIGLLDMRTGVGVANTLMRMNLRLEERLREVANVYLLNTQRWIEAAGRQAFSPKLWYMAKTPFGHPVLQEAARSIKAALVGLGGGARKLILVDLDETLWGGLVGEVGWEQLTLGGHDPVGEAYSDFQRTLKGFARRGILLGIVSKNDEHVALKAIDQHPEMILRREDFAGWKINWRDKALNVAELAEELNLGLQSIVFIDDSPVERGRVREALPEVLVPDWPEDPMLFARTLLSLGCFETPSLSAEDRQRTQLYAVERQRDDLKRQVGSLEEWFKTLQICVRIEALNEANVARAAQLLNKTNQMNLSTRRLTEAELAAWAREARHKLWTVHVADRFGSSGLTGLISLETEGARGRIVDFILSCRVMGRQVEEAMVATAITYARSRGLAEVHARYLPTPKNQPCLEFWQRSGFQPDGSTHEFHWDTRQTYPRPPHITVT